MSRTSSPWPARRWWTLGVLSITQLMVALDATVINIALPWAQNDLGFSAGDRQWLITAFAVASAVGGAAHTFTQLVVARCVQGVFGALLAPAALAALTTTFRDPGERSRAFAIYGAIGGSGLAVDSSKGEVRPRLDVLGTVVGSLGLFFVVYGFGHAVTASWADETTWGSLVLGGVLLGAFAVWQDRSRHPLVPPRLLVNRTRGGSLVALFITNFGVYGISLFLAYYLQNTLGCTPIKTGVYFLPLVLALALSASLASARLLDMVGPRPLVPEGMVLGMLGMILFTKLTPQADCLGHVLPGLVVTGLGLGLIFAPATASATAGIHRDEAGAASALVTTAQQVGGSVGVALLNTIAVRVTARFLSAPHGTHVWSVLTRGTLHGYAVAFWWAAGFFGVGAVLTFIHLESGVPEFEGGLVPLI